MTPTQWLIAGIIFIIIIFLTLGIGWWIRNHPPPPPLNKYSAPLAWGPVTPTTDDRGECQLYTFSPTNINGHIYPGNPTFNTLVLNNMEGNPIDNTMNVCTDIDQLYAGEVQHSCTGPLGVVDGQISLCRLLTGGVTGLGGTEVFYSNAFCQAQIPCAGQLAVVALNYHPGPDLPLTCIQNDANGPIIATCNPANPDQLFRITRTAIGVNPLTLSAISPQNGLLAQIYDRTSGLCLAMGSGTETTIYIPPTEISCTGTTGTNAFSGPNVILSTCTGITGSNTGGTTGALYPGYNWAFFPSMRYCSYPGGGCTGKCPSSCKGCTQVYNANACTGPTNCCTGFPDLITPPQISYIANINITQLPYGPDASYAGLSGSNATVQWLLDNNVKSLYYGGYGKGFILKPFGVNSHWCPDTCFASQYINIATYNTISQENICYADGFTSSDCINF